jgi:hypothetical protein
MGGRYASAGLVEANFSAKRRLADCAPTSGRGATRKLGGGDFGFGFALEFANARF